MKHTKGAWTGGKEAINDRDGRLLATVRFKSLDGSDIPNEEGYANSRLIAAAPEMLSALQMALTMMKLKGLYNCQAFRSVALAIEEATGVAQ